MPPWVSNPSSFSSPLNRPPLGDLGERSGEGAVYYSGESRISLLFNIARHDNDHCK
jgi:hypothetical protein